MGTTHCSPHPGILVTQPSREAHKKRFWGQGDSTRGWVEAPPALYDPQSTAGSSLWVSHVIPPYMKAEEARSQAWLPELSWAFLESPHL